jgi:hypothetical protein
VPIPPIAGRLSNYVKFRITFTALRDKVRIPVAVLKMRAAKTWIITVRVIVAENRKFYGSKRDKTG